MLDPDYFLFARVVAAGSLSAAARDMGISPAMASKRMARLEARLGAKLIHRPTRRLALTERGEGFHRDVLGILAAVEAAENRLRGPGDGLSGPLRLSAPTSFGRMHLAPHLKPFLDRHPGLNLTLDLSDGFSDLIAEKIDLAIRISSGVGPGLEAQRLATSRRILCASPAYLEAHGAPASLSDLSSHRLLAASGQLPWRLTSGKRQIEAAGVSHVRTNSSEVVRELALSGLGIALRSLWDVSEELASGRLVQVLPEIEGSADVGIYAVRPRGEPSAAVVALTGFIAGLYAPAPWEEWGEASGEASGAADD
jgi:DNA-binding transcriptional LysR family regulator